MCARTSPVPASLSNASRAYAQAGVVLLLTSTPGSPMHYTDQVPAAFVTVVGTPEFIRRAGKLMTEGEREELISYRSRKS